MSKADMAGEGTAAKKKDGGLIETLKTLIYAGLIAFVVRGFIFEPFNIPSGSMIPTLLVGDYIYVSKFAYGYSALSSTFGVHLWDGRIFSHPPKRGDVVVFKFPPDPHIDYIKRLVGMPGDRIQVIGGVLHVNGTPVQRVAIEDFQQVNMFGAVEHDRQYRETLPGGVTHRIIEIAGDQGRYDNTAEYVVPQGYYFMMGDNRDNSSDSRVPPSEGGVGYVPADNLVGRAEFIFFSIREGVHFWELWKWPTGIRYGRLLQGVR